MSSISRTGGAAPGYRPVSAEVLAACARALGNARVLHPGARAIAVTSSRPGEGRSTIAAGLGMADVRTAGRRCIVLDLDTDSWGAAKFSYVTAGRSMPERVLPYVSWATKDLGLLEIGGLVDGASLTREQVDGVIQQLLQEGFDVVGDLSCLPPYGGGDEYAGLFEVVMLVVEAGATPEHIAHRASQVLVRPPVILLNRTKSAIPAWLPLGGER